MISLERLPCADGTHHTSVMLFVGKTGKLVPFPSDNWELVDPTYKAELANKIRSQYTLEIEDE